MVFFLFHVGQRVHEIMSPHRHGTVTRIYHPGPRATIWVRLDGLGTAAFTPSGLAVDLPEMREGSRVVHFMYHLAIDPPQPASGGQFSAFLAILVGIVVVGGGLAALVRAIWRVSTMLRDNTLAVRSLTVRMDELASSVDGRFDKLAERVALLEWQERSKGAGALCPLRSSRIRLSLRATRFLQVMIRFLRRFFQITVRRDLSCSLRSPSSCLSWAWFLSCCW